MREVYRQLRGAVHSGHHQAAVAENLLNQAKWPLRWLHQTCPTGGEIPKGFDDAMYGAALELLDLSKRYLSFEAAFTFAGLGLIDLSLDGRTIRAPGPLRADSRFEAYNRLAKPAADLPSTAGPFLESVASSVRVEEDSFTYVLNPQVVRAGLEALEPALERRFVLPRDWTLPGFTLSDFGRVARTLIVLAIIHFYARVAAAEQGCLGLGIARALILMKEDELVRRLVRYSGVPEPAVAAIVETLTFARRHQTNPDPALQPLVLLSQSTYGIAPNLIINSSMERNLAVLLNRLPEERRAYESMSQDREQLCRDSVVTGLAGLPFRFWHGHVAGWGKASEIDLAIVADAEEWCLVLELKSFVGPAEPREVRDRSNEIARGIEQVRERVAAADSNPTPLREALGISDDYEIAWAVASETSIGAAHVQAADVPVVNAAHLVARLRETPTLAGCCAWLGARGYLPVSGVHYEVVDLAASIGEWTLEWYGIRALADDLPGAALGDTVIS